MVVASAAVPRTHFKPTMKIMERMISMIKYLKITAKNKEIIYWLSKGYTVVFYA